MTVRKIRLLLWVSAATLTAGAVAVGVQGLFWSKSVAIVQVPKASSIQSQEAEFVHLPSIDELQTLCQRDLRQALYDPPPPPLPAPPPPPPPPSPPPFTLAGTVTESGHCRAMLVDTDGNMSLKRIGEITNGAEVRLITRDSVTLKYQGQDFVLKVLKNN